MIDKITKYQKYLLGLAIFLSLTAVSISVNEGQVQLNFRSYPLLMILLVLLSIVFIIIYIQVKNHQLKKLAEEIQSKSEKEEDSFTASLATLTSRQKTVYDLILDGKSNKEIKAKLFIEHSTLKSHINQIYKKLKIKSRKELKSKQT